jgi:DNA anti-recombination protein RmuC
MISNISLLSIPTPVWAFIIIFISFFIALLIPKNYNWLIDEFSSVKRKEFEELSNRQQKLETSQTEIKEAINRLDTNIDARLNKLESIMSKGRLYDPDVVDACLDLFNRDKFEFKSV